MRHIDTGQMNRRVIYMVKLRVRIFWLSSIGRVIMINEELKQAIIQNAEKIAKVLKECDVELRKEGRNIKIIKLKKTVI